MGLTVSVAVKILLCIMQVLKGQEVQHNREAIEFKVRFYFSFFFS